MNYEIRLITSAKTGNTVTYTYDHAGARVKKTDTLSGVPTYYVTPEYEVEGTVTRHHIVAPGVGSIASMLSYPTYDTTRYHLTDHLGGTHVEVDYLGNTLQYMVYEPFGKVRYSWQSGSYSNDYKYTGKEQDSETSWQYYGARYYDNNRGQFMSADPVFLMIGATVDIQSQQMLLRDPQIWNSYSYARENPYLHTDSSGQFLDVFIDIVFIAYDIGDIAVNIVQKDWEGVATGGLALGADVAGAFVPFATGAGVAVRAAAHADDIVDAVRVTKKTEAVIEETLERGRQVTNGVEEVSPHFTSQHTLTSDELLDAGNEFLGPGYSEIDSGVYRSVDGSRQFRIDDNSLMGNHNPWAPHGHFEIVNSLDDVVSNNHVYFIE